MLSYLCTKSNIFNKTFMKPSIYNEHVFPTVVMILLFSYPLQFSFQFSFIHYELKSSRFNQPNNFSIYQAIMGYILLLFKFHILQDQWGNRQNFMTSDHHKINKYLLTEIDQQDITDYGDLSNIFICDI